MKTMDSSSKPTTYCKVSHLIFEPAGKQMLNGMTVALYDQNVYSTTQEIKEETETIHPELVHDLEIKSVVADHMICNCCHTHFVDREEQLGHYKCDWHRYNLHLRLKGLPCVSEEEFEEAAGDVSSISGSDEDDEVDAANEIKRFENDIPIAEVPSAEENSSVTGQRFYKVFFKTKEGELISLFRCLLHQKKSPLYNHESLLAAAGELPERKNWIILMVASGHFAGSVFNGTEVVDHKTFHRYTVRAKRGTAQSTMDSQGGAPKSAGANLRRYNEAALLLDVQDLLSRWEEHIQNCHLVFIRIPVANRIMFFGGKNPAFKKDDTRIRVIPFNTRRPTFNETKRVHQILASLECYGKAAEVKDFLPLSPPSMYDGGAGRLTVRTQSPAPKPARAANKKQHAQRTDVGHDSAKDGTNRTAGDSEGKEREIEMDLVETLEEIDFTDLKEFDSTVKKKHKRKKPLPTDKQNLTGAHYLGKEMARLKNSFFTACKIGCLESVQTFLEKFDTEQFHNAMSCEKSTVVQNVPNSEATNYVNEVSMSEPELSASDPLRGDSCIHQIADTDYSSHCHNSKETSMATTDSSKTLADTLSVADFLNMPLRDDGTTFLHIAGKEGHAEIVTTLLRSGADPAVKNKEGKTPYNVSESEVRNAFRRFMGTFPDRYDYLKAQVPSPLTAEMEAEKKQKIAEKKKAKKKATTEQRKDKKAAEEKIRRENQEKERFLALSEREKRALAAEKRILQQCNSQGVSQPVLSRCWQCGSDITGKVPFEYSDYKFCTTKCLKEHRSQSSASK